MTSLCNKKRNCPPSLFAPLIKIIIEEIRKICKEDPIAFGFNPQERAYEPLKLMQAVMAKTNEVCLRYQDNSILCSLPQPQNTIFEVSTFAMRNGRKKMEDRHVIIHDLSTMFNIQEASPSSYYAVFDGHAGHDAAAYSSAHLHQYLAENKHFTTDPQEALLDAFCKTDALFVEKCKIENLSSGTTALVALLRPKEQTLYIAWAGDSLALLVNQGRVLQCVNPHKPSRADERERIHNTGGACMMWAGIWRVSGQLAVSRAIGDAPYKPFVTAVPDVREISLDGGEDFLILACDGLWDYISEDAAAQEVYYLLAENSDDTERISKRLAQLAKYQGSTDNISIIVVFLREPSKIAADAPRWATRPLNKMDVDMDQHTGQLDNQFANSNGTPHDLLKKQQNENLLLNLVDNLTKSNGTDFNGSHMDSALTPSSNGTSHSEFHHEDFHNDDFGPETDVDAVDEVNNAAIISSVDKTKSFQENLHGNSALENAKAIHDAILGNTNPFESQYNPFSQEHEKGDSDVEIHEFDRQQSQESEDGQRDETPTPPIEAIQESAEVEEVVNQEDSDSEDEWNFIKGDEAKKGPAASQPETVVECAEEDAMSQLNPNAAEFVPVSPTRSIPSPSCRLLMNDEVIAHSPKRPVQMDIKIPNENEFDNEVKSRPSNIGASLNGYNSDEDLDTTPKDPMEAFLNGKDVDEIPEFRPSSVEGTPTKSQNSEEFHFGPNSAPFTPKLSETVSSTRAVFGDESTATLDMTQFSESQDTSVANKENNDPMNMSFSEERGDANPFSNDEDLNKVHVLPEDLDEFLRSSEEENKENIHDFTISDLPEHFPLGNRQHNNDEAVKTTDLDHEGEKELASPIEPELEHDIEPSKTPQPTHENLLGDFEADNRIPTPDSLASEDLIEENKEVPPATSTREEEQSCEPQNNENSILPEPSNEEDDLVCQVVTNEFCTIPKQEENLSYPLREDVEIFSLPNEENQILHEELNTVQPREEENIVHEDEQCTISKQEEVPMSCNFKNEDLLVEASFCEQSSIQEIKESLPEYQTNEDQIPQSSELEENIEVLHEPKSLTEDVTSSVKDDVSSPVSPIKSPEIDEISRNLSVDDNQSNKSQHDATELHDLLAAEPESLLANQPEVCLLPTAPESCPFPAQNEVCAMATNLSFNTEPLILNDQINSFLDQAQNRFEDHMQQISEQIHIKTDNIVPEFAHQEIITPSDESKGIDIEVSEFSAPAVILKDPVLQDLISPIVKEEPISTETPKPDPVEQKTEPQEAVKEEVKKSETKKPLNKATPSPKPGVPKTAAPKAGTAPKTSAVSPRVPSKTGISGALKPPISKTSAPTLSSKTTAAPKPKTSTTTRSTKPTESKPLLNGDVKNVTSKIGVAAKKPIDSKTTTSKPAPITKSSPTPRAPISRPPTAPKVPAATLKTTSTTARPISGVSKTASTTAPKPKPTVSSTRTTTTASKSLTSTVASRATSTVSKTSTVPKTTSTVPPKPKTITSAPKLNRVPLTKTITKNAELEKQNKESANKLTASRSTTVSSTRTTNLAGTKTTSTTVKKTETKPLTSRTAMSKTTTITTKSTLGKKPSEVKSVTKTTKVEKPKENGISATVVTEEITMVNSVVNETVNNIVNADSLVNNGIDSNLLKDNSPIDNKLIDNLIGVNGVAD